MRNFDEMIARNPNIKTLPTIFTQLSNAISNPLSTIQDVVNIVIKDQTSASKLIKVVNSPVYALSTRIDTVSKAIFYLGFNEVKNIILSLSVMKLFENTKVLDYFNILDLWKHSIAVAVISRTLAAKIGVTNLENYFVSGLLHDIGKVVLFNVLGEEYAKLLRQAIDNNLELKDVEKRELGITHEIAGEILSNLWKLPPSITRVIRYHSVPGNEQEYNQLVSIVHLADIIAQILNLGNSGRYCIPQPDNTIWDIISLPKGSMKEIVSEIKLSYSDSLSILKIGK